MSHNYVDDEYTGRCVVCAQSQTGHPVAVPPPIVDIENWVLLVSYLPNELRLKGLAVNHPKGAGLVTTSPIVSINFQLKIAETKNTFYRLGVPHGESKSSG